MFIKNLICNYNAQELLLIASRLTFALNAWVTLILIMELTIVLLLVGKKMRQKIIQPIVLGLHDYISTCSTNNYNTILHQCSLFRISNIWAIFSSNDLFQNLCLNNPINFQKEILITF
jgi:hypothetical protein